MIMAAMMIAATGFAKDIKTVVFNTAPEMHCNNCENRIKNGLKFEKGVKDIKTDLETKTVTIEYDADKTNVDNLVTAFAKIEYKATEAGKGAAAGEKKGGCCKKKAAEGAAAGEKKGGCCKKKAAEGAAAGEKKGGCCKKKAAEGAAAGEKKGGCCKKKAAEGAAAGEGGCKKAENTAAAKPAKAPLPTEPLAKSDKSVKFKAEQMHCGGCANKVKRLMYTIDGVCWVEVDMPTKVVTVSYQSAKTNPEAMKEAFKTINYTVEDVK